MIFDRVHNVPCKILKVSNRCMRLCWYKDNETMSAWAIQGESYHICQNDVGGWERVFIGINAHDAAETFEGCASGIEGRWR